MIEKILAVLFAVSAVLCAWTATYIPAAVFAVLYLVFFFIPMKDSVVRFVLLSASGFPLVLAAGNPFFAGIVSVLLLLSLLGRTDALSRPTAVLSIISGAAVCICALQSSAITAIIISAVLLLIGLYVLFITEYRIRKNLKVNPHERN